MPKHVYEIRNATEEDAICLAENLREADVEEVKASVDLPPLEAILGSMKNTIFPKAGTVDGEVACIFGVASNTLVAEVGRPWLLATDALTKHSKRFLKSSLEYIKEAKKDFKYMHNFVDARNKEAIRWIKWLGFEVQEPAPHGPYGVPFCKFELKEEI